MKYETIFGQSIAVVGSIDELGKWQEPTHHLIWTTGHVWKSEQPLNIKGKD